MVVATAVATAAVEGAQAGREAGLVLVVAVPVLVRARCPSSSAERLLAPPRLGLVLGAAVSLRAHSPWLLLLLLLLFLLGAFPTPNLQLVTAQVLKRRTEEKANQTLLLLLLLVVRAAASPATAQQLQLQPNN
jgi:hypothetical protein